MFLKSSLRILALKTGLVMGVLWSEQTLAYPEFIGFGYKSCMTCHMNGQGGGPLSDYGRGVWASEIASRDFNSKSTTPETLSERSNFLGSYPGAWWLKPHIKSRSLELTKNPGSEKNETNEHIPMQFDVGASILLDQDAAKVFVFTYGYIGTAETKEKRDYNRMRAREYYFRWQLADPFFIFVGKMDKVYGIRNIDHTASNRSPLELTQNSQSHGLIAQWVGESYEVTGNYFLGNLDNKETTTSQKNEQKGASLMVEFDPIDMARTGFSVLQSKSENKDGRFFGGIHWKQGLPGGSAFLFEYGIFQRKNEVTETATNGTYSLAQGNFLLRKGLFLTSQLERYNVDAAKESPDIWKYGMGFLYFPVQRLELRLGATDMRLISSEVASEDNWAIQGQLHVSL